MQRKHAYLVPLIMSCKKNEKVSLTNKSALFKFVIAFDGKQNFNTNTKMVLRISFVLGKKD